MPTPPPNAGLMIGLNAAWPADQIARAILKGVRDFYGERLDVAGLHAEMEKIWTALQNDLTPEEKGRLAVVSHVSVPLNDFNARIASPPSRNGYFILFDAMIDLRVADLFMAPRNPAAWSAAYVRAAWGNEFGVAHWVGPAMDRLKSLKPENGFPDSYSVAAARDFIFAHECGHFFRNHLHGGRHRQMHFGGGTMRVFDPAHAQEVEADAFACDLLARTTSRPLALQQIGVDWLLGFMGAVVAMRQRAVARRTGDPDLPVIDAALADRRERCRVDFDRHRAAAASATERTPETATTVDRVRMSVNNFNRLFPPVLADIYAEFPDELLAIHSWVVESPMTDAEVNTFVEDLDRLHNRVIDRHRTTPRRLSWRGRFRTLMNRLF